MGYLLAYQETRQDDRVDHAPKGIYFKPLRQEDIQINTDFHFQEWAFLAKVDPEAFEIRRRKVVEQFLQNSSERQRTVGRRLQREIDANRNLIDDPQVALAAISRMLWQQVSFLCDGLNDLSDCMKRLEKASIPALTVSAVSLSSAAMDQDTASPSAYPASRSRP